MNDREGLRKVKVAAIFEVGLYIQMYENVWPTFPSIWSTANILGRLFFFFLHSFLFLRKNKTKNVKSSISPFWTSWRSDCENKQIFYKKKRANGDAFTVEFIFKKFPIKKIERGGILKGFSAINKSMMKRDVMSYQFKKKKRRRKE